jgi:predicted small secreted protein
MKKILVSIATTLMATAVLVACNGTTGSDITSGGATQSARATCSSLANWQSVGIGMSADQVQDRLGKPAKIVSTTSQTEYEYEACRGFNLLVSEAVPASGTTPAVEAKFTTKNTNGIVVISPSRGVISVTTPVRIEETIICEWDYYTIPYAAGQTNRVCRTSTNPF